MYCSHFLGRLKSLCQVNCDITMPWLSGQVTNYNGTTSCFWSIKKLLHACLVLSKGHILSFCPKNVNVPHFPTYKSVKIPCVTVRRIMRVDRMRVWGQELWYRGQLLRCPAISLLDLGRAGPSHCSTADWAAGFDISSPIRRRVADSATCCENNTQIQLYWHKHIGYCSKYITLPTLFQLLVT